MCNGPQTCTHCGPPKVFTFSCWPIQETSHVFSSNPALSCDSREELARIHQWILFPQKGPRCWCLITFDLFIAVKVCTHGGLQHVYRLSVCRQLSQWHYEHSISLELNTGVYWIWFDTSIERRSLVELWHSTPGPPLQCGLSLGSVAVCGLPSRHSCFIVCSPNFILSCRKTNQNNKRLFDSDLFSRVWTYQKANCIWQNLSFWRCSYLYR